MAQQRQEGIQAEAIEWHVRLQAGGPEDWDTFIRWLEADPAHSAAYDRVKFADAAIRPDMMPVIGSRQTMRKTRRRRRAALAAAPACGRRRSPRPRRSSRSLSLCPG
jgi:transmembrane sensor